MNPKHILLLKGAVQKFELLTYPQITSIFLGQIKGRTIERCYSQVAGLGFAHRVYFNLDMRLSNSSYRAHVLMARRMYAENLPVLEYQIRHRLSCNDVLIALAKRSFVLDIIPEHEIGSGKIESPVIGRRPDGLFKLNRGNLLQSCAALEVETTLRNRSRIREVIRAYSETFKQYPDRLTGVLIVACNPTIANAYRESLADLSESVRLRFVLSEKIDLSDVKETILGRSLKSLADNTNLPIQAWAESAPETNIKSRTHPSPEL